MTSTTAARAATLEELVAALAEPQDGERDCITCGCTDLRACAGGCSWASINPPVCSRCTASGFLHMVGGGL